MASNQIVPYVSSSSSNSTSRWKYDVFLSFRGEDTRKNFTDHLYAALDRAGIKTFRDDDELQRGEEIGPELVKAIEESRFSIIVLSKNYASSTWCLDELEHILACRRTLGHTVLPVFYDINPSDVRKQKGRLLAEAFREHDERFKDDMDKVTRWRVALREVANLKGLDLQKEADGHESKNIDNIVKEILDRLHRTTKLSVAIHPVGLSDRAEEVISMLCDKSLDVCIVGIYGIGGLGKTTIAKEVYNSISDEFEASCFLANVRENSDPKGMIQLQKQLLCETLMGKHEEIYNVDRGLKVIEERLRHKRVLIVLDDVDEPNQLNQILGDRRWLSSGSRVIITTRIVDLLKTSPLYKQYEVQELDHSESLQLLSLHAFDRAHPIEDYMECAQSVVRYASGIPLVLEVLGSSLVGKHIDVWNGTLDKLKVISNKDIHTRLKISYDSLDHVEKSLFLDIACFFVGFDKECVIGILDDCEFFPITGIDKLMTRCLLSNDFDNKLRMHDLLRDMGREIVRQEAPNKELGNRNRLWRHKDALDVLTDKTGTKKIEGLILDLSGQTEILSTKAFKKMNRLRLLQLNYVHLTGSFENFSRELRWLCWHGFALRTMPADLHLGNLVSLDMQYSKLNQFPGDVMYLGKLKFLDLSHSHMLTKISNFEGFPNLEILRLEDCTSLVELHDSIRVLTRLRILNLQDCRSLGSLPRSVGTLRSVKNLIISYLHPFIASPRKGSCINSILLPSLKKLNLSDCNLSDDMIPHDLGGLTLLETLNLSRNNFSRLPASIVCLPKLRKLLLKGCKRLQSLLEFPSSLINLSASDYLSLASIKEDAWSSFTYTYHGFYDIDGCPKLKLIEGFFHLEPLRVEIVEKLLRARGLFTPESLASVRMHMLNYLTRTKCISPLQALSEGGIYSIFLPLSDIPSWFSHQREGNKISLHVPALQQGCKIIGFILCVVYESKSTFSNVDLFNVTNYPIIQVRTKKFQLVYNPTVIVGNNKGQHNAMWLSHWAFENINGMIGTRGWRLQDMMEEGDQVDFFTYMGSDMRVKRWGIHLLYQHNDQGSQSIDLSKISCASQRRSKRPFYNVDSNVPKVLVFSWCLRYHIEWKMFYGDADERESTSVDEEESTSVDDEEESTSVDEEESTNVDGEEEWTSVDDEEELMSTDDEEGEPECMIEMESNYAQREKRLYDQLWAIDAPSKMKYFLWCCLCGTVPVQEVLDKRGIRADGCCFCAEAETLHHLLLQCPFAHAVWLSSPLQLDLRGVTPGSFMLWLLNLCYRWEHDEYKDNNWRWVTFTVWMIWKARNDLLYRAMKWDPISISYKIVDNVSRFIDASWERTKIKVNTMVDDDYQGHKNSWMKPPFNVFKLTVHASWIKEKRCGSVGAIILDPYGKFVAAMSKKFNHIPSARSAKAVAVLEALQFCSFCGLKRLLVEGDSKEVLKIFKHFTEKKKIFKHGKYDVELAAYVEDFGTLAAEVSVQNMKCVGRELNLAARRVASYGCCVEDEVWWKDPPAGLYA